jgi:hypothetical protein
MLYADRITDGQARCEAILRANPDHVNTAELHLACIEGSEVTKERNMKRAAIEGTVGVAAIGLAVSLAGMMLGRKK